MSSELESDVCYIPCIQLVVTATEVTAGLAGSSLPLGGWLKVTCALTACTPGSAPDQTLGNEYGKTWPFLLHFVDSQNDQLASSGMLNFNLID